MDTSTKCGGCLWYGAPGRNSNLGECENADSEFYWNRGADKEAVRISPKARSCRHYKSARLFLGGDSRAARVRNRGRVAWLRTGLYQLSYPLVLTGVLFYYIFRSGPEEYDTAYTRTEREELSL